MSDYQQNNMEKAKGLAKSFASIFFALFLKHPLFTMFGIVLACMLPYLAVGWLCQNVIFPASHNYHAWKDSDKVAESARTTYAGAGVTIPDGSEVKVIAQYSVPSLDGVRFFEIPSDLHTIIPSIPKIDNVLLLSNDGMNKEVLQKEGHAWPLAQGHQVDHCYTRKYSGMVWTHNLTHEDIQSPLVPGQVVKIPEENPDHLKAWTMDNVHTSYIFGKFNGQDNNWATVYQYDDRNQCVTEMQVDRKVAGYSSWGNPEYHSDWVWVPH